MLKAIKIVLDRGHELSLVLTGNLADDAECLAFARGSGLEKRIILTGEISEVEMYGLYRYAALAAVPTLSEGGFPWQALEAMAMEIPVIVSRIPVVEERLRYHGLQPETCGLPLFEPHDENVLAQTIIWVLTHRAQAVSEQKTVRDTLLRLRLASARRALLPSFHSPARAGVLNVQVPGLSAVFGGQ